MPALRTIFLASQGGGHAALPPAPDELAGGTLTPGIYSFVGAADLAG